MPSEHHLKHSLELTRKAIIELKQSLAFQILTSIASDVESLSGTPILAEYQLLTANAYAMSSETADTAEAEYQLAVEQICNLPTPDSDLEMRVHEDFGNYLVRFRGVRSRAREHFLSAKKIAILKSLPEDTARIELKIVKIDLESDRSPLLPKFRAFKNVAAELGITFQKQLAAWTLFCGENEAHTPGLVAARDAGKEYFRGLLRSIR